MSRYLSLRFSENVRTAGAACSAGGDAGRKRVRRILESAAVVNVA
jgi:hypothetical protein